LKRTIQDEMLVIISLLLSPQHATIQAAVRRQYPAACASQRGIGGIVEPHRAGMQRMHDALERTGMHFEFGLHARWLDCMHWTIACIGMPESLLAS